MRGLCALLLLAPLALAQITFEPRRIEAHRDFMYYFPTVEAVGDSGLFCTWAVMSAETVGAFGRGVSLLGNPDPETVVFRQGTFQDYTCPPELSQVALPDGGEVRLILHA